MRPPVETASSVPAVAGGYTRTPWKCEFTDVKALLAAYVEGKCFLDEEAIKKGLQSSMDKQAQSLGRESGEGVSRHEGGAGAERRGAEEGMTTMKTKTVSAIYAWCRFCQHNTVQDCLPDVSGTHGLPWKCRRCLRTAERTAHEASTASPVLTATT